MKLKMIVLLLITAIAQAFCGVLENSSGVLYYPAIGTVNRNEGTIQITMTPNIDLDQLKDGWPMAIRLTGVGNRPRYAALAIYSIPGGDGMSIMMRGLKGHHYAVVSKSKVNSKAGVPVNMVMSWGPKGFIYYVNGKKIGSCKFYQPMIENSPFLYIGRLLPFYVSRIMVTTRQLDENELQNDPKKDFSAVRETSLLANDLNKPKFFITDSIRKEKLVTLVPFDLIAGHIYFDDEVSRIRCTANNVTASPVTLKVNVTLTDTNGVAKKFTRDVILNPDTLHADIYVPLAKLPAGFYKARFNVEKGVSNDFTLSVQPRIAGKTGAFEEYLGTAQNMQPEILKKLGIRWARSWGSPYLMWYQVEPTQGNFDFKTADAIFNGHLKNNVKILGVLGYPPKWAAQEPDWTKHKRYSKSSGRWKPRSVTEWNNYVSKTAEHFKGRVTHYEIYNECDFKTPGYPATFSGSTEDYFELLKGAYKAIHAADPQNNKLVITGFSLVRNVVDEKMPEDLLKMGAADYVDIWNLHSYQVFVKIDETKKMVFARKKMPIWQTEHMWHMLKDQERLRYVSAAIPFWFIRKGFDKFFTFGWGEYLSNDNSQSLQLPMHTFGVIQQFLRITDKYIGNVKGLPTSEFDTYEQFRLTNGKYLAVFGSSVGSYDVEIADNDVEAYNECGAKVEVKNGKISTGGHLILAVTSRPLTVKSVKMGKMKDLIYNKDFELLDGDAFAGIEHCSPSGWNFRNPDDKKGTMKINTKDGNGKYAVELKTTGTKRGVYVFSEPRFAAPGFYRFSANVKCLSGSLSPYFSVWGRDPENMSPIRAGKQFPAIKADGKFHRIELDFEVKRTPDTLTAAIIGFKGGPGMGVIDDVDLVRLEVIRIPKGKEVQLNMNCTPFKEWKSEGRTIPFDNFKTLPKKLNVKGIPFKLGDKLMAVGGKSWKGYPETASVIVPQGKYKGIYLLVTSMYCSKKKNTLLGHVTLTSASGKKQIIHLREGVELADWYHGLAKPMKESAFEFNVNDQSYYNLFLVEMRNPMPGEEIVKLELTARNDNAVVAMPAVTLEK